VLAEREPVPDAARLLSLAVRVLTEVAQQRQLDAGDIDIPREPDQRAGQRQSGALESAKGVRRAEALQAGVP
jgi:hypothetical protein